MLAILLASLFMLPIVIAISIAWVKILTDSMNDPNWKEHSNESDYWGWPY